MIERCKQTGKLAKTADMQIVDAACGEWLTLRVMIKKCAVIFFGVGIAMPACLEHTGGIMRQPHVRIVTATLNH